MTKEQKKKQYILSLKIKMKTAGIKSRELARAAEIDEAHLSRLLKSHDGKLYSVNYIARINSVVDDLIADRQSKIAKLDLQNLITP